MHGDTLCTDDVEYQKFRAYAHDPENQRRFLAQPLPERRQQMLGMRAQSEKSKQAKAAEIMDVAPAAVEKALRESRLPAADPRPHPPSRAARCTSVDGHALRALGAERLVRPRAATCAATSRRLHRSRTPC